MKKILLFLTLAGPLTAAPWPMHIIDNTSRGADGVRLLDINNDKRLDIATGWRKVGLSVRIYTGQRQGDRALADD